jgi:hypothetical protein
VRRSSGAFLSSNQTCEEELMHRFMGRLHAGLIGLRSSRGQGTVEYVALILLIALVMAGVIAAMKGFRTDEGKELGDVIIGKIKDAVRKVEF